jgi:hypothetical protein
MAEKSSVDRREISIDLDRARVDFNRLLVEADREAPWENPTRGTRWNNEQLLFHMVFGYMVVQRLLILVKDSLGCPIESAGEPPRAFPDPRNTQRSLPQ